MITHFHELTKNSESPFLLQMEFEQREILKIVRKVIDPYRVPTLQSLDDSYSKAGVFLSSFRPHNEENMVQQLLNGNSSKVYQIGNISFDSNEIQFQFRPQDTYMYSMDLILISKSFSDKLTECVYDGFKFGIFKRYGKKYRGYLQLLDLNHTYEMDEYDCYIHLQQRKEIKVLVNFTSYLRIASSLNNENMHADSPFMKIALSKGVSNAFEPRDKETLKYLSQDTQFNQLNTYQKDVTTHVIKAMTRSSDLTLVCGPPGTGKTRTVCVMIYNAFKKLNKKSTIVVLVCAASNAAVSRVFNKFIEVYCEDHHTEVDLEDVAILGRDEKQIDGNMLTSTALTRYYGDDDKNRWDSDCHGVSIVFCTVSGTMSRRMESIHFEHVFVDEAGQLEEFSAIMLIQPSVKQIVMIGDPKQLPALSFIANSEELKSSRSFFERFWDLGHSCKAMLMIQYRMDPLIAKIVSKLFYDNQLENGENVKSLSFEFDYPFNVIDYQNVLGEESGKLSSFKNEEEATRIREIVDKIIENYQKCKVDKKFPEIGIITGYSAQKERLRAIMSTYADYDIQIDTVDAFQGQEKDIIILSLVRTKRTIGFFKNFNRVNVAISRPKKSLIIVGKMDLFKRFQPWSKIVGMPTRPTSKETQLVTNSTLPKLQEFPDLREIPRVESKRTPTRKLAKSFSQTVTTKKSTIDPILFNTALKQTAKKPEHKKKVAIEQYCDNFTLKMESILKIKLVASDILQIREYIKKTKPKHTKAIDDAFTRRLQQ